MEEKNEITPVEEKKNELNTEVNNNDFEWKGETEKPSKLKETLVKYKKGLIAAAIGVTGVVAYNQLSDDSVTMEEMANVNEMDSKEANKLLREPNADNFVQCYSVFETLTKNGNQNAQFDNNVLGLYVNKLAQAQYEMLCKKIDKLPTPSKRNVDEVTAEIKSINWMPLRGYDNTDQAATSTGALTHSYYEKKMAYVRAIANVYLEMGYSESRIATAIGGNKSNNYGIKN